MTQNRKRSRNIHDDDTSEFTPLSKRINNLHINNVLQVINNSTSEQVNMYLKPNGEWGPGPPESTQQQQQSSQGQDTSYQNPETPENEQGGSEPPQYTPELDETQNPYYYNNKLLFDLFVERMQRNGHNHFH